MSHQQPRLKITRSFQILPFELLGAWGMMRNMGGTLNETSIGGSVVFTTLGCKPTRSISTCRFPEGF